MAVNSITFGGVNSADFGIYISGEGVFNAPKRDVEMIKIPGRNGEFALDNGRFENIEVTYPAFNFEPDDYDTFMQNLSDFRNAICAQRGYQRLTDTFHPDEYRMATYIGGLEIKPVKYNTASEFNIVFNCKPQRWLTSGETAVAMTSGDTLTNPTLFESSPLLEVGGYGTIEFNGYDISFEGVPYGEIAICQNESDSSSDNPCTLTIPLDTSLLNSRDRIYPETKGLKITCSLWADLMYGFFDMSVVSTTNVLDASIISTDPYDSETADAILYPDLGAGFVYGTARTITSSAVYKFTVEIGLEPPSPTPVFYTETVSATIAYDGADTITVTVSRTGDLGEHADREKTEAFITTMYADSSQPNPAPIFIDCDLGEAYTNEGGVYRSLNQYIDLGSDLPKLGVGANEISFDNTIVNFKMTPRWWKV